MSRIRRYILFKEQAEHSRVTGWFSVVTVQVVHSPNVRYKLDFKGVLQQNVPCQFFSRLEDSRLPCLFICNCCLRTIIKYSYSELKYASYESELNQPEVPEIHRYD